MSKKNRVSMQWMNACREWYGDIGDFNLPPVLEELCTRTKVHPSGGNFILGVLHGEIGSPELTKTIEVTLLIAAAREIESTRSAS